MAGGYGAPQGNPYAPPQAAPMGGAFGAPIGAYGAAPMGMVPVGAYGNPQVDAEIRKANNWAIAAIFGVWILAIPAFSAVNSARQAAAMGDSATAISKAKSAQTLGLVSVIIGVVIGMLYVLAAIASSG